MTVHFENKTLHIGWATAISVFIFTVSTTWAISNGLNNINQSVKDVRNEMHVAIDSVKNKQQERGFETDLHFQRIEDKLDRLSKSK